MKKLVYKGIVFDDYAVDEYGNVWAEMCESCAKKFEHLVSAELDDGLAAMGYCSVEGCEVHGMMTNRPHYYIDFKNEYIEFEG